MTKFKNQSHHANKNSNHNKNGNPQKAQNQQPPKNDSVPPFNHYNCGLPCHMARKCKNISNRPAQAHMTTEEQPYTTMITEINIDGIYDGWWMDTSASRHVCFDCDMFKTYIATEDQKVLLGDSHTTEVDGIGNVELKFTSKKTLILKDVMNTPKIRKSLVYCFLLNKVGFELIIQADMYTITKNGIFIGKWYATDDMFKLNINMNKISSFAYMLCDFNISNGELEEEIYMEQPEGFIIPRKTRSASYTNLCMV